MKPNAPHDPFDDLIAAALHGDLSPAERAQFDSRIANDPAASAAYHEAQSMHDLLEKTHQNAQPDPAFEQRMVSAVRRKLQTESDRETAWESAVFFYRFVRQRLTSKWTRWEYGTAASLFAVVLGFAFMVRHDLGLMRALGQNGIADPAAAEVVAGRFYLPTSLYTGAGRPLFATTTSNLSMASAAYDDSRQKDVAEKAKSLGLVTDFDVQSVRREFELRGANTSTGAAAIAGGLIELKDVADARSGTGSVSVGNTSGPANNRIILGSTSSGGELDSLKPSDGPVPATPSSPAPALVVNSSNFDVGSMASSEKKKDRVDGVAKPSGPLRLDYGIAYKEDGAIKQSGKFSFDVAAQNADSSAISWGENRNAAGKSAAVPVVDERKLIRNAQLELEVKSFQDAIDSIASLTKQAGGYVDTSNSQKGGNGKLQGTVVVKVLPQNLDAFLLKLRDLGRVQNQSVSTDDVTKAYFDTQARLDNSRRMETQLQDLLKHANSKVADLLQVERELGRVRGEIEQMQGRLKLYDFQVQYATVTMQLKEKDLNQTAAYLLREQDNFSLFATNVEVTFQHARQTAENFKAEVLTANLNHNSGSDVSAELVVMVAPDQVEAFLTQVRGLGRVANFTRQTQRVAKDGGDSDQPADQTLTEKDKVQVHLAIRSDDETRKQVALTVVAKTVDDALDQAKTAALASVGVEILSSSLNKTPQGQSTAQLAVRVPGKDYATLMAAFKALGRTASLSIQRNDNSGPGANGDDAPVIVSLALTDNDTPLQQTALSVLANDVDGHAQQIKKNAATAGVEVKASSFQRQPDGTELAQMTFRLPMGKYAAFVESVKALGKVESLTVRRDDRPDQTVTDDTAPVEINLVLHNQADLVAPDNGLFATLRHTFVDGAGALFGSVRIIGVLIAFVLPWLVMLAILAWVGRRIYISRKK